MNTYVYAVANDEECHISTQKARNYKECQEKIISKMFNKYTELEEDGNWKDFLGDLYDKYGILIGEIIDISEIE